MHVRMNAGDAAQLVAPGNVLFGALALYIMLIQLLVRCIPYLHRFTTRVFISIWLHGNGADIEGVTTPHNTMNLINTTVSHTMCVVSRSQTA